MQNGVTLSTKEDELVVKYGPNMYYREEHGYEERESARSSVKYILCDLNNIRKYYIRLGFHLEEFHRNNYYLDFGYFTFDDFCEDNFGLDKSAVSRCVNVYRAFNASNSVTYENGIKQRGAAIELSDEWKDFSYSQLCEMLPLTPEQRKDISSDMSVNQIRAYKKNLRSKKSDNTVATSQQEKFDTTNYSVKKGIVQQNYVKNCKSLHNVELKIFNKDGKLISSGEIYDVLLKEPGTIYLREHVNEIVVNEFL